MKMDMEGICFGIALIVWGTAVFIGRAIYAGMSSLLRHAALSI
jgi:hypothetical protein